MKNKQLWAHRDADEWRGAGKVFECLPRFNDLLKTIPSFRLNQQPVCSKSEKVWKHTQCSTKGNTENEPRIHHGCLLGFFFFQFHTESMVFDAIPEVITDCLLESYLLKETEKV